MASGGTLTPGSHHDLAQFPPEVLRAAVDEAHRLGLEVTAHAHAVSAIADAVAAGVDGLEHVTFWTEDGVDAPGHLFQLIAGQRIVVGATVGMVQVPGMAPPPPMATRIPGILASTRRLYQAGAAMVAGTDAGIAPVKPHDVVRRASAMLGHLGFGQAEALRAITSVAAAVCGLGQVQGAHRARVRRRHPRRRRRPNRRPGRAAPHPGGLCPRRRCARRWDLTAGLARGSPAPWHTLAVRESPTSNRAPHTAASRAMPIIGRYEHSW